MTDKKLLSRSPLLPVGIAMILLAAGFTFGPAGLQWLWQSEPHIAVLVAVVGTVMVGAHFVLQARRRTHS